MWSHTALASNSSCAPTSYNLGKALKLPELQFPNWKIKITLAQMTVIEDYK